MLLVPSPRRRGSLASALAALALAVAPAGADETTYSLREEYKPKVGDKVRVHERNRTGGTVAVRAGDQVLQEQEQKQGVEQRYEEHVHEVGEDGKVSRATRRYTFVADFAADESEDLSAKPVEVMMTRKDGQRSFAPVEGHTLSPLLERVLDMEAGQSNDKDDDESRQTFLPEGPVAVGATWPVSVEKLTEVFGMDPADLEPTESNATGKLEKAEPKGGVTMLSVLVTVQLRFKRFQGMDAKPPFQFDMKIRIDLPAGGKAPGGGIRLDGIAKGKAIFPPDQGVPPGTILDLDMTMENAKSMEPLAQ